MKPVHFLLLAALAGAGVLIYFLRSEVSELGSRLSASNERLERVLVTVEEASARAEAARERAAQAEENAREAARGRLQAEAAANVSETARRRAMEDAERAAREAEQARREAEEAQEEAERIKRERAAELNRLQEALGQVVETRRTALGLVMNLGSDSMQFDFDQAFLRPENRELLSRIIGILLTTEDYGIYVYGHTDDVGTDEYNLDLSRARAEAVQDYLVEAGIAPARITTRGFGKSHPVVSGTTAEARAKNRRVEIGIVEATIDYQAATPPE